MAFLQHLRGMSSLMVVMSCMLFTAASAVAQGQREVNLIQTLGEEQVETREQLAQEQAELEHRQRLEEQTQLRRAYREYLGAARRTALHAVEAKRNRINEQALQEYRDRAHAIIRRSNLTKAMIQQELDPIYAQLEEALAPTREELYAVNPRLLELRRQIAPGNGSSIAWIEEIAIQYALAANNRQRETIAANVEYRNADDYGMTGECDGIDLCNRRRLILGLNPLAIDYRLVQCCRDHSNDMRTRGFFAHNSPVAGKETPWKRAELFETSASGENIAAGYGSERRATMGWWYSPGHLKNMMGRGHHRIGLGTSGNHYTQLLGR